MSVVMEHNGQPTGDVPAGKDQQRQSQWIRKTLTPSNVYILLQTHTYTDNIQSALPLTVIQLHELLTDCMAAFYGTIGAAKYDIQIVTPLHSNTQYICQCSADALIPIRAALALCGDYKGRTCWIDVIGCSTTLIGLTRLVQP